nr:hypothetical protein [Chryseobacterium mulctrae]
MKITISKVPSLILLEGLITAPVPYLIHVQNIRSILSGMVEQLCYQLRHEKWLTSTVSVRIRYANFDTETKQCKVPYTSADHTLLKYILELFRKVYTRRMRIRLIGVKFTGF